MVCFSPTQKKTVFFKTSLPVFIVIIAYKVLCLEMLRDKGCNDVFPIAQYSTSSISLHTAELWGLGRLTRPVGQ